jgi:subtilase family serine protease
MRHRQTLRQLPVVSRCALILCAAALASLLGAAQASAQATPCADLFISDVDVNPDPPVAGTPTVISVTVHNGGTCTAPGFVVQWRRDRFASTGPSKSVASLGAGEDRTIVVSSDFTYPSPGNYQSIAEVDTGSAVSETNENNNLEQRSITVVAATRNLTVTGVSFSPNPVVRGRQMTANVEIRNTGNSPTSAFRVEWTPFIFGTPLSRQVTSMAPGETRVVSFNFTYPFDGTVDTTATVDTTNVVAETNEFDNSLSKRLVVEPPLPDLEITNVVVDPAPAGSTTTVRVTVTNTGNDPAGTFRVSWQPWFFAAPLSEEIGGLAVGQSQTVEFEYVDV